MQKHAHQTYSFGEFTLDITRGSLLRGSAEIKLRPKSFDVLKYLTENNGRLVGKNELIDFAWQGMAVTDDSLVQCLKEIRRALGDDTQQLIKTVPRRGYIFDKDVSDNDEAVYSEETSGVHLVIEEFEENVSSTVSRKSILEIVRQHKIATIASGIVLVAILVTVALAFRPILAWYFKPPSIAILPIVNATGDPKLDYISDGVTDNLITGLTQVNTSENTRLRVLAQFTMFGFKNKDVEPRNLGRELGVDSVLASKMFEERNLRTFKLELINVEDGSIIWSKQFAMERDKPFEISESLDQMTRETAAHLPLLLSEAELTNLTRRYTSNAEAYDLYLKGRSEYFKVLPSSLRQSIVYYQQAVDLDPNFALAYWAMALSYSVQAQIDERAGQDAIERSTDLLQHALRIDNNLAVAQNALKNKDGDTWQWDTVKREGRTHPSYGTYLLASGRGEEEIVDLKQRISNGPGNPVLNFRYCVALSWARHTDDALEQCKKTANIVPASNRAYLGPFSPWVHVTLSNVYVQKQMYQEALAEQKTAVELAENSKSMRAELASIYAISGQKDEAYKILDDLIGSESQSEYTPSINIAIVYCSLGDREKAFSWLERAFNEREDRLPNIRGRTECDWLHDDPRFWKLYDRMGLPH